MMMSAAPIDRRTDMPVRLARLARCFATDCSGASAVEYGILTLIAFAVAALVFDIGSAVSGMYEKVAGILN
jgi:Flp pilus assembly pilin Flp